MEGDVVSLAVGGAALAVHVPATALLCRLRRGPPPVLRHVGSAAVALLVAIAALALIAAATRIPVPLWPAAAILYGGAILWLFAYSALYKSVSLSVLVALTGTPDGRLSDSTVARQLVLPRFEDRVAILARQGLAAPTPEGHRLTERGRRAVTRLERLQRLFGIERSGLYDG